MLNYKKNYVFSKGMQLKFNLSLCNGEATKKLCSYFLRKSSLRLQDILLDKVPKKVKSLKPEKNDVVRTLKNNIADGKFLNISRNIKQKVEKPTREIKSLYARKYKRHNIKIIESACRNRRLRRTQRKRHNREQKKEWLERKKQVTLTAKANCADQNAINLTPYELLNACKSLLAKGQSFIPTAYDIDSCTLKQSFDNFVNKLDFQYVNSTPFEVTSTNSNDNNSEKLEKPPLKKVKKSSNFV